MFCWGLWGSRGATLLESAGAIWQLKSDGIAAYVVDLVDGIVASTHVNYLANPSILILVGADDMAGSFGDAFGTVLASVAPVHSAKLVGGAGSFKTSVVGTSRSTSQILDSVTSVSMVCSHGVELALSEDWDPMGVVTSSMVSVWYVHSYSGFLVDCFPEASSVVRAFVARRTVL